MPKRFEVHIFTDGDTFTVWQEDNFLIPKLTWEQAWDAAERLGGEIVVHAPDEDLVIDLTEPVEVDERDD